MATTAKVVSNRKGVLRRTTAWQTTPHHQHKLESRTETRRRPRCGRPIIAPPLSASNGRAGPTPSTSGARLVAEDSAAFDLANQSLRSWTQFIALLAVVSAGLYGIWIDPNLAGLGTGFVSSVETLSDSHEVVMLAILVAFGVAHSGMAALRPQGERMVGARAYRVAFALISLPLALTAVTYFINHRYSGAALFDVRSVPGVHGAVWWLSFASFFFLYPSTFNILEVAAVDEPKVHLWETGVMRVTRHPQMVGQVMWSLAHCLWMGNSFAIATSAGLCAYHAFGCWHGDRRLEEKFGSDFVEVKNRTSVLPFAAILDGRQVLPRDYWKEWVRVPYLGVVLFTLGAYACHPAMQTAAHWVGW